ncbi:molybdopterin converting factor subunit 1 [Pseudogemmobacter sonorensis]|uniref:molybdopterin converting factor subunit 1 n=1 Tax=Pseudogemmobacter sonorensis TaxID=2989681 RepID=UPI00367C34E0
MIEVLYFAWLRERVGLPRERVETGAATVAGLVEELIARGEGYALAFQDRASLRVALDQEMAEFSSPLAGVREVAFFPPMTGG